MAYVTHTLPLSNWIGRDDSTWYHGWTIFYWAWWISWSPFIGMFIARVSKGRTVHEFLIAVLLIPTVVTLVWMSTFAGVLLYGGGTTALSALQAGAVATGLPFTVVLLLMCCSLYIGLHRELYGPRAPTQAAQPL